MLAETEQVKVMRVSDIIETAALGQMPQPKYLNAVAEIETALSVEDFYRELSKIETSLGRVRKEKWSSRIIDLDLLLFGRQVINYPNLTIPHPQLHLRSFVLNGLCQLNPDLFHPFIKEPVSELAARLAGSSFVPHPELPQLVSVAGIIGVGKTTLTKKLSKLLACKVLLEPYDQNPFLPQVYAGKKELALDSQLYFLTSRIEQLNHEKLPPGQIAINDYIFEKELIYAERLLNPQQLSLYKKIYSTVGQFNMKIARPVLVIYLRDSVHRCLERIRRRNRPYEQNIELRFLEALDSDYQQLFSSWNICPVIRKQVSQLDYAKGNSIAHLANQIRCYTFSTT